MTVDATIVNGNDECRDFLPKPLWVSFLLLIFAHYIKANDLKRIERMIAKNTDIIINRWYELFKIDNEDNQ